MKSLAFILFAIGFISSLLAESDNVDFVLIRVEITGFENKIRVVIDNADSKLWISEIHYRVIWPERYKDLRIIERCSLSQADSSLTWFGNILSASAPIKSLESKERDTKGRIVLSECLREKKLLAECH
jgi:hypothetical protein